jgi:protein subunit release factor A
MTTELARKIRVDTIHDGKPDRIGSTNFRGVRVTYLPTGDTAEVTESTSAIKNRALALNLLAQKLEEKGIDIKSQLILR